MAEHISSFIDDRDGWPTVNCTCGFSFGPVPGWETAADVWGDHIAEARAKSAEAEVRALHEQLTAAADHIDRLQLSLIEAQNPGIDMDEVKRLRAATADPTPEPETDRAARPELVAGPGGSRLSETLTPPPVGPETLSREPAPEREPS